VGWKGQLALVPLPDEAPTLQDLSRQYPDRQEFGAVLLSLANDGIFKRIGTGRPRGQPASKLAGRIAAAWQETVVFDVRRQRWMAYGVTRPGIWGELPEVEVYARVRVALTPLVPEGFSWSLVQGVERLLRTWLKGELPEPSRDWLPFPNGALQLSTGVLEDHTPARAFTWCLPFEYAVLATCPTIKAWLLEAQKGDKDRATVLLAYLKAIVTGRTDLQKFLECIGPGGTGKGTYLRLAHALVGWENVHATTLELLETTRFETASLEGKRLVLITDADRYGGSINTLKALTGGDPIRAERKYLNAYTVTPEALVLVAANEAVQSTDYTSGLERRRITLPFQHKPAVERRLIEFHRGQARGEFVPELPGLMNAVLAIPDEEIERLLRRTPEAVPSLQEDWRRSLVETNPLAAWADAHLVLDRTPEAKIQIGLAKRALVVSGYQREDEWLYPNYCRFAVDTGVKAMGLPRFPRLLDDLLRQQLRLSDVSYDHDGQRAYIAGVRLRREADTDPGLITVAIKAQSAPMAPPDPSAGEKLPVPGSSGDRVGEKTQASKEFREFRGFSQNSLGEREEQGQVYKEGFENSPKPPEVPRDGDLPPEPSPTTPERQRTRREPWTFPGPDQWRTS
jgi:putative DNA primase/helicase